MRISENKRTPVPIGETGCSPVLSGASRGKIGQKQKPIRERDREHHLTVSFFVYLHIRDHPLTPIKPTHQKRQPEKVKIEQTVSQMVFQSDATIWGSCNENTLHKRREKNDHGGEERPSS
jgi:hypothetical protein